MLKSPEPMNDEVNEDWHRLGSVQDFDQKIGHERVIHDRILAVFYADGQWYAVDGMCAHQGGPIAQGMLDGKCVTCPWHGWQYRIDDGVNVLTNKKMLETFPVQIRDDALWVQIQ